MGVIGLPGVDQSGADAYQMPVKVRERLTLNLGDPGEIEGAALSAAIGAGVQPIASRSLALTNPGGLRRWLAARGGVYARQAVVTVVGDSISRGVGSDDTNDTPTTPAQEATYRRLGWVAQLRRQLCASFGTPYAENWVGLRPGWAYDVSVDGATASASIGPYGGYTSSGAGGLSIGTGHTVTINDGESVGPFTEIDVYYWGSDSGVFNPCEPLITIDGNVANGIPEVSPTGMLKVTTITGLTDDVHEVVLGKHVSQSSRTAYVWNLVVRRAPYGVVVNRIAQSGADSDDLAGTLSGAGRTRVLTSTAMPGITDLLVIALGTNDQGNQVPLAQYKSNLQELIDIQTTGGGCTLILGEPPRPNPTGAITESMYRAAAAELALTNEHVAFADGRPIFGDPADALTLGLYPVASTVHPSAAGHGAMANAVSELLMRPNYI